MTRRGMRAALLGAASAAALMVGVQDASAGAFGIREQSATAQGQSFAGAASGAGGLSSMYWNPATVTMSPGYQGEISGSVIDLNAKITPQAGTSPFLGNAPSGDIGQTALVPSTYTSYQINDMLWLGLSSNAPFGLVTKPNQAWSGQIYARTSRVFSGNFNPIIGIKVTDWLSVAAGPTIEYLDIRLKRATSFVATAPTAELKGDATNVGFSAGVTITPFAGTTIGVGYRSSIDHDISGRVITPTAVVPVKSQLNTPDLVTVGLTQAITNEFRVNLGYEFANWSRLGTIGQVSTISGGIVSTLPLNYKDGHFASLGVEYDMSPELTVRAGGAYEWSPIDTSVRLPSLPDANRIWASLGASYRFSNKLTIDLAYSHIFADTANIRIQPGSAALVVAGIPGIGAVPLTFNARSKGDVNIFSAALRFRWDDPAVAIPAGAIRSY